MNKKITIIPFTIVLLSAILSSTIAIAESTLEENESSFGIIESQIDLKLDKEFLDPINPSDYEEIKITVGFKLNLGSIVHSLLTNRRIGRTILFGPGYILKIKGPPIAIVDLKLSNIPEWCTAELENSSFELNYGYSFIEAETKLSIEINESAEAFESANITIKAEYSGHWTIKASSNSTSIKFMSAYIPKLSYEELIEKELPPINLSYIPINITNIGNGITEVLIEIEDIPENWNLTLDRESIIIPSDQGDDTRKVNLIVEPLDEEFTNETINIILTPKSTSNEDVDDKYLEGRSETLSVFIQNDGSHKDNGEFKIEVLLFISLVIIAFIIIALILLLFKNNRK